MAELVQVQEVASAVHPQAATQAYSYVRFSSAKQELGDSLRRQLKLAVDYAEAHDLTLNSTSYQDLACSAFRGKNAATGYLKAFTDAVDRGQIPKDSYLLVESVDRLSRGPVLEARKVIIGIIERGITLVLLQANLVYTLKAIGDDWTKLIVLDALMANAHEESKKKSERIKEAWDAKRARGDVLSTVGPAWLELDADGVTWKPISEKVKVVERVFDLAQRYGTPTIARMLNSEGVKTLRHDKSWSFSTVYRLLTDPVVIGIEVPEAKGAPTRKGRYPAIISETTFYKAKESRERRCHIGAGPPSTYDVNLLAGILYCRTCGSRMRVLGAKGKYRYLSCISAYGNTGCKQGRIAYRPLELTVLRYIKEKLVELLALNASERIDPTAALKVERDELDRELKNLVDALVDVRTSKLVAKINETHVKLDKLTAEIEDAVPPKVHQAVVGEAATLISKLQLASLSDLSRDERMSIRDALKKLVHSIHAFTEDKQHVCYIWLAGFEAGASLFVKAIPRASSRK